MATREDIIKELNARAQTEAPPKESNAASRIAGTAMSSIPGYPPSLLSNLLENAIGDKPVTVSQEPKRMLAEVVGNLNTFTGGLLPEAYATAQSANSLLKTLAGQETPSWAQNRDAARQALSGVMEEYPTSATMGSLEGLTAQSMLTGGGGAPRQALSGALGGYSAVAGRDPNASPEAKATGALSGTLFAGILGTAGRAIGGTGKLVGDLELGERGAGSKYHRLLGDVNSIDDASSKASKKISEIAENKVKVLKNIDNADDPLILLPGRTKTQNPMTPQDVMELADDYYKAGDAVSGDAIKEIGARLQTEGTMTRLEALRLKQAISGEAYLPSGALRSTKAAGVMESWANRLRNAVVKSVPEGDLRTLVKQADSDMTDLYGLIRRIDKAVKRPISVSISGLTKAIGGKPAVFNTLQNVGTAMQQNAGAGGAIATGLGNAVLNE